MKHMPLMSLSLFCIAQSAIAQDSMFEPPFADMPSTTFVGKTIAGEQLKYDIMFHLGTIASAATKCPKFIERIESSVAEIPKPPTFNQARVAVSGEVIERWNLTLCNKQATAFVRYFFTPEGRTNFSISVEPGK